MFSPLHSKVPILDYRVILSHGQAESSAHKVVLKSHTHNDIQYIAILRYKEISPPLICGFLGEKKEHSSDTLWRLNKKTASA